MENIYRDNSNPSNVFENGASYTKRQISFNSLSNQKLRTFKFNDEDKKYNCERKSHHGNYRFIQFSPDTDYLVPRNPVGK